MKNLFSPSNWGMMREVELNPEKYERLTGWEKFAVFFIIPVGVFIAVVPSNVFIDLGVKLIKSFGV